MTDTDVIYIYITHPSRPSLARASLTRIHRPKLAEIVITIITACELLSILIGDNFHNKSHCVTTTRAVVATAFLMWRRRKRISRSDGVENNITISSLRRRRVIVIVFGAVCVRDYMVSKHDVPRNKTIDNNCCCCCCCCCTFVR